MSEPITPDKINGAKAKVRIVMDGLREIRKATAGVERMNFLTLETMLGMALVQLGDSAEEVSARQRRDEL
jgi:hypothetical protein